MVDNINNRNNDNINNTGKSGIDENNLNIQNSGCKKILMHIQLKKKSFYGFKIFLQKTVLIATQL